MTQQHTPALEEAATGKTEREIEHTMYGKISDLGELEHADWEDHEQWELKIPKHEGNLAEGVKRVRKTMTPDGQIEHVLTLKTKDNIQAGNANRASTAVACGEDMFEQFKALAAKGMVKRRFKFPIEGSDRVWEIDVFPKEDGGWHQWCKIDLEVPDLDTPLPKFPIKFDQVITKPYGHRSAEEDAQVKKLYDECFTTTREQIKKITAPAKKDAA